MKYQADIAYYARRARQSRIAAATATEVCSRGVHEALVEAYDKVLVEMEARQGSRPDPCQLAGRQDAGLMFGRDQA